MRRSYGRWGVGIGAVVLLVAAGKRQPARAEGPALSFRKETLASGLVMNAVAVADFNGDRRLDVAAAGPEEVAWYERMDGAWTRHLIARATRESGSLDSICLTPFDLDGDGKLDLIASTPANGSLAWYENPGDASRPWVRHLIDRIPHVHSQALGDVDGDGRPDLVANTEGMLVYYSVPADPRGAAAVSPDGGGTGGHWTRKVLSRDGVEGTPHYLHFLDVHGDGKPVLCAGAPDAGYLAWWERPRTGAGEWSRHTFRAPFLGASHLLLADIDGDGKPDLFYSRGHSSGSGWLAGPDFARETEIDAGTLKEPHALTLADVDGDRAPDVAAAARNHGGVVVWRNDGKGHFHRQQVDPTQTGMDIHVADLDGDGRPDLVVAGGVGKNVVCYRAAAR